MAMIETEIPKDIRTYKTKLFGPFTLRQTICVTAMGLLDIVLYTSVIAPFQIPYNIMIYILTACDLPFACIGFFTVRDLPLEKYLIPVFIHTFLAPTKRKVKNVILPVSTKITSKEKKKKKTISKKELANHPEYKAYE